MWFAMLPATRRTRPCAGNFIATQSLLLKMVLSSPSQMSSTSTALRTILRLIPYMKRKPRCAIQMPGLNNVRMAPASVHLHMLVPNVSRALRASSRHKRVFACLAGRPRSIPFVNQLRILTTLCATTSANSTGTLILAHVIAAMMASSAKSAVILPLSTLTALASMMPT